MSNHALQVRLSLSILEIARKGKPWPMFDSIGIKYCPLPSLHLLYDRCCFSFGHYLLVTTYLHRNW